MENVTVEAVQLGLVPHQPVHLQTRFSRQQVHEDVVALAQAHAQRAPPGEVFFVDVDPVFDQQIEEVLVQAQALPLLGQVLLEIAELQARVLRNRVDARQLVEAVVPRVRLDVQIRRLLFDQQFGELEALRREQLQRVHQQGEAVVVLAVDIDARELEQSAR